MAPDVGVTCQSHGVTDLWFKLPEPPVSLASCSNGLLSKHCCSGMRMSL